MRRFLRCVLLFTSLLDTIITVGCQSRVRASLGDSALLPCVYRKPPSGAAAVYWKDGGNVAVLDIKNNKAIKGEKFGQRVESFPEVYQQGNFSIVVRDVQPKDAGVYDCFIPTLDFQHRVSLAVSGKPTLMGAEPPARGAEPPARGASPASGLHTPLLLLLLALTNRATVTGPITSLKQSAEEACFGGDASFLQPTLAAEFLRLRGRDRQTTRDAARSSETQREAARGCERQQQEAAGSGRKRQEAAGSSRKRQEPVMNLLWLVPLLLGVRAERLTQEVEVDLGQSVVLNCSVTGDIVWYLEVSSQVTAAILRTFSPDPGQSQHYMFPKSKYQALNNSLRISNLTEEDLTLYFCGVPPVSGNFSSGFRVRSVPSSVPVAPPTNSSGVHQQNRVSHSEAFVFATSLVVSLSLNILLLLLGAIASCVYGKRSCRSQMIEPSPLTPDNQEVMEMQQVNHLVSDHLMLMLM
ncbi:uncharacterized protein V6R79_003860 [Siganus canaliculatus]